MKKTLTQKDIEQNPILKGFEAGQKVEIREVPKKEKGGGFETLDGDPPGTEHPPTKPTKP